MKNISAVIVVKGNPVHLPKVISSIEDLVKEIIVVDIGIDNALKTSLINNKLINIVEMKNDVPYVELIREKTKDFAKSDYVFFLDPDEIVPHGLKIIIREKLDAFDYFKIPRKNITFGRWIRHSRWWPDYQVRLFKKDKVIWPKIIHRQPKVEGLGYTIEPREELALLHHNYQNIDEYLSKFQRYAKYEAKEIFESKKDLTFSNAIIRSLNEFISRYFAGEGYKDGGQGIVLAFLQMFYYLVVYFYYLEMKKFKIEREIKEEEFFRKGLKETLYWKKKKNLWERILQRIL
ncbi:MAG: glycosyltransferase family 2 protein [Patescibacteria group bacterium]